MVLDRIEVAADTRLGYSLDRTGRLLGSLDHVRGRSSWVGTGCMGLTC